MNTLASRLRVTRRGLPLKSGTLRFLEIVIPVALLSFMAGAGFLFAVGCGVFVVSIYHLILFPDRPFMIRWLIVFVALLQWVVAPGVAYDALLVHSRQGMWVPQSEYMLVAVPAVFAFAIGVFFVGNGKERVAQRDALAKLPSLSRQFPDLPFLLMLIAVGGSIGSLVLPGSLAFVSYLLSNMKYAAVILILFSDRKDKFLWIGIIAVLMLVEAAASSMFHDAILWMMLIGGAYMYKVRMNITMKFVLAILFLLVVISINSVKAEYRDEIWDNSKEGSAVVYFDMTLGKIEASLSGDVEFDEVYENMVIRLNQGRIISRIIYNVPAHRPYLGGESIWDGIVAAFVPRFIMPNKARAGGHENFRKMTGWALGNNTSMGVSILGESYGNYGLLGGTLFMGLFGLSLGWVLTRVMTLGISEPLLVAFLPCIFIHVVKAETDFVTVANFMIKASILYTVVFLGLTRVLHYRFRPPALGQEPERSN